MVRLFQRQANSTLPLLSEGETIQNPGAVEKTVQNPGAIHGRNYPESGCCRRNYPESGCYIWQKLSRIRTLWKKLVRIRSNNNMQENIQNLVSCGRNYPEWGTKRLRLSEHSMLTIKSFITLSQSTSWTFIL